jgi:hypothetical protein
MASLIQWTQQAIGAIKETLVMERAAFFIDRHGLHTSQFTESWRSFMLGHQYARFGRDRPV